MTTHNMGKSIVAYAEIDGQDPLKVSHKGDDNKTQLTVGCVYTVALNPHCFFLIAVLMVALHYYNFT